MPTIDGGGRDQRIKEALEKKVICRRCQVEMVPKSTFFDYLGHNFHTEILCCPKCGGRNYNGPKVAKFLVG